MLFTNKKAWNDIIGAVA